MGNAINPALIKKLPDGRLQYRLYELPLGMSAECFVDLVKLINGHQLEESEQTDQECAIRIFQVVQSHLSRKEA